MDIVKSLSKNSTILLILPVKSYNNKIIDITKSLSDKAVCYVTLNKTSKYLYEVFRKNNVDMNNVIFIDAISKSIMDVKDDSTEDSYYVSSPSALTELSIVITKFLHYGFKYFVFDSLNILLTYNNRNTVEKFFSSLSNRIESTDTSILFLALKLKENEDILKKCSVFVDKVVDLT